MLAGSRAATNLICAGLFPGTHFMNDSISIYFKSHRFRAVWLLIGVLVSVSLLTRLVLFVSTVDQIDVTVKNLLGILTLGFFYDLINAGYFIIPCVLYLWLVPESIFKKSAHRFVVYGLFFFFCFLLLFSAAAEYFFWDEFQTRFNFIAVDYLVYTTEVIGNIRESYPIEWILVGIFFLALAITFVVEGSLCNKNQVSLRFGKRTLMLTIFVSIPVLSYFFVDSRLHGFSDNAYVNELAGNGIYELFAAYLNNELDYEQFYPHIKDSEAFERVRNSLSDNYGTANMATGLSIEHQVRSDQEAKRLNVVLISTESFSAEFMHLYGNDKGITPFLDSLVHRSLVFTNLYATGTRTVRGLEALSLSVPPTPGQSIVRRPHNERLFTLASVFNEKGYDSKYIYGGYGYFDNMNYFFGNNGYTVVDRTSLEENEIDYENIWGVADENLFTLSLREINKSVHLGKPAFVHIMTTSNHRPYTYPDGRIDIPSHTGRDGAVKYTDYAIGKFIREASKMEWYANTVFIITADHCASSAGKTELPIQKYLIPMLIFSPAHIAPGVEDRLMSQIDIAPTLLGLLDFSYSSKFYGYDIYKLKKGEERAFISTYQALGFLESDSMVVLMPRKIPEVLLIGDDRESTTKIDVESGNLKVVKDGISWYQSASAAFKNGAMKE
jgi:phosphoglycerol transferase MdoB-like AlkP superfamily enzyme